mgnify:CR=1 FL=1
MVMKSSLDEFQELVNSRSHWSHFSKDKHIADDLLTQICKVTQRAPTSFNSQPYKIILVRSDDAKQLLGAAMLNESNAARVTQSDVTAVFCADLQVVDNIPKIQKLFRDLGSAPEDYIENIIPMGLKVQSMGFSGLRSYVFRMMAPTLLKLAGLIRLAPAYNSPKTWAFRQLGFVTDHFVLAATAAGLGSAIMEGFSCQQVSKKLAIPSKYKPFCLVSLGYKDESSAGRPKSLKFPMEDVFSLDTFANPYPTKS